AVDGSGAARLEDLKPGVYRVLRLYQPKDAVPLGAGGAWRNDDITVEVTAGKELTLPPLAWSIAPGPVPKGGR
ncbi:MAG TPA: hypothetical protein VFU47_04575, partial [Armatimonadota bacterium]|nr:hypothetical protein [Armatimonadota bacterium]